MLQYHVYSNDGAGGPVDYSNPIAATAGLTFNTLPLAPNSDHTFAVRASDPATGLEEENTNCRVRIVTDAASQDISARPAPPLSLTALRMAGGGIQVHWLPSISPLFARATGFKVYNGTPTPDYSSPVATVASTGARDYRATLAGLADGVTFQIAVRAFNASGEESNTNTVSVTADATPPNAVDSLTVTPTFEGD